MGKKIFKKKREKTVRYVVTLGRIKVLSGYLGFFGSIG